ncbi:hypothetical protein [Maribellus sediminis]|uniref:hypothetical protein n=1 Tax=Maribellus sediminis TaxID=2696285 RepID=UPI0014315DEE|nr:hypothetical protein [Maribellus sediminis]
MKTFTRILVLMLLLPAVGCNDDDDSPEFFLFVENFEYSTGVLLSGPEPPILQIDYPTYRYHEQANILEGEIDFELNKHLKLIYGSGVTLSGTAGGGGASGLYEITELPFEKGVFTLHEIAPDGSISVTYRDSLFTLAVNEKFIYAKTTIDTVPFYAVGSEEADTCITQTTTTRVISNFGFIPRENIQAWEW